MGVPPILRPLATLVVVLAAWEIAGRVNVTGVRVLPAPSVVFWQYIDDYDLYLHHILATLRTAAYGFVYGNAAGILAAVLFVRFPLLEQLFRGVNITLFAVPMIAVGPVLVILCDQGQPQVILSALTVYFPTMAATLVGLRDVDPRPLDVIRAYGGGETAIVRFVRLRAAVPGMFAGLKIAASLAVLGAILGEFGSGERWGLGTFLLGSLGQANAARLWGISFAAAGIAMAGFGLMGLIGRRVAGSTVAVTVAANRVPEQPMLSGRFSGVEKIVMVVAATLTPFLIWWAGVRLTGLTPIIAPGPVETITHLFASPQARTAVLKALGQTLPMAGAGLVCGLLAAFLLAVLSVLMPRLVKAIMPVALVLQSTPLVAIAPLILLFLGRDVMASLALAVIVVFFPAFVLLAQGFALVPRAALEVVEVYGAGRLKKLLLVSIPYSTSYLFAAARLVAPRALLGVMVAEWLLTGTGLGYLIDVSRADLDFLLVWSCALVSILVAVGAYQAVTVMERLAR